MLCTYLKTMLVEITGTCHVRCCKKLLSLCRHSFYRNRFLNSTLVYAFDIIFPLKRPFLQKSHDSVYVYYHHQGRILSSHQSQASRHHTWIMICRTHKDLICERLHQLNREIDLKSFISWDSRSYQIDSLISLCLIKVPMMGSLSRVARWNRVWYQGNNQVLVMCWQICKEVKAVRGLWVNRI